MKVNLKEIAEVILKILNRDCRRIVAYNSMSSTRAIGDAVQEYLADKGLQEALDDLGVKNICNDFSRRSMEDMAFEDENGNYYAVDVKTHNLDTQFNMPNLISVRRLANFYKNDKNSFCLLVVSYKIENAEIHYEECFFEPIEMFSWTCLTLGALGWGQIQIANANKIFFEKIPDRKTWMLTLCEKLDAFYEEQIGKIGERQQWFDKIRQEWLQK